MTSQGAGERPFRIVLASRSPQRSAILTRLGINFQALPADVQEREEGPGAEIALENALRKARAVAQGAIGENVLGIDTVVELEGTIYGKPADEAQARETLLSLSGRTHTVHSGVALLLAAGQTRTAVASTDVSFREIEPALLERVLASGEWRGRSGGYAIQGVSAALVREVRGEYENVVGLPIATLIDLWPQILER